MNILTIMFKDRRFEEGADIPEGFSAGDKVPATQIPVMDWGVEGSALIGVISPSVIVITPLAEIESAVVQLDVMEGADESTPAADEGVSTEAEVPAAESAIVLPFAPDFTGSGGADEGDADTDEG